MKTYNNNVTITTSRQTDFWQVKHVSLILFIAENSFRPNLWHGIIENFTIAITNIVYEHP